MDVSASVVLAPARYDCPLCNFASTRNQWISHLRSVHKHDKFNVVCTKCASFVSNVYRKHRKALSASGDARNFTSASDVPNAQSSSYEPNDLQVDQSSARSRGGMTRLTFTQGSTLMIYSD